MDTFEMHEEEKLMDMMEVLRKKIGEVIKKHTGVNPDVVQKINENSVVLTFSIAQDEDIYMGYILTDET